MPESFLNPLQFLNSNRSGHCKNICDNLPQKTKKANTLPLPDQAINPSLSTAAATLRQYARAWHKWDAHRPRSNRTAALQ